MLTMSAKTMFVYLRSTKRELLKMCYRALLDGRMKYFKTHELMTGVYTQCVWEAICLLQPRVWPQCRQTDRQSN